MNRALPRLPSRFGPLDPLIEPPRFAVAFDWLMPHLATQSLEPARQLAPSVTRQSRARGFDGLDAPALDFTIRAFQSRLSPFSNRSAWLLSERLEPKR